MGKTYIDTVKYIIYANVEIGGLVEKPDVVGALFGQTEGLLGDELDLRELQKNGRIGRIEVELTPRGGRSVGKIKLPSSLDMVETSILAAALETVDRVGPCEAHVSIDKIEDQRSAKRKMLIERAKSLLKNLLYTEIPESKEISEQVRAEVKVAEISEYGPEKLPAGPGVESSDSVILVEGRADVINLLKNGITNVVGVGGANVSPTIAKLCQEKEVTVFLDGDRGGDIILAELARIADIDFVARAPNGKEVEELTRKEIIKCLRSKMPFEEGSTGPGQDERQNGRYRAAALRQERYYAEKQYPKPQASPTSSYQAESAGATQSQPSLSPSHFDSSRRTFYSSRSVDIASGRKASEQGRARQRNDLLVQEPQAPTAEPSDSAANAISPAPQDVQPQAGQALQQDQPAQPSAEPAAAISEVPAPLLAALGELEGTLKARFYSQDLSLIKEIAVRDMIRTLESEQNVYGIVFDGIITQRLADLAESKKAAVLVGMKLGNVFRKPASVLLYTKT
jgi:DNA primase